MTALEMSTRLTSDGPLQPGFEAAWRTLGTCVKEVAGAPVLWEGGNYPGTWVESTASISAEILARFAPDVAIATVRSILDHPRDDGLLPYKVTRDGPAYRQIQMVTPFARSVWRVWELSRRPTDFLNHAYKALVAHDRWLATHRDTRGTGSVEAFCTFDTGHDLSPRFWHIPDVTPDGDPARYDQDNPLLPLLAPDLTANVACQRRFLARMAGVVGEDPAAWLEAADTSERALWDNCFDAESGLFLDTNATGQRVQIASDVLLRVLACGVGDDSLFDGALRRYLLNTRKFFSAYPFTSIAMDDPRFDRDSTRNTWAGPTNLLTLVRAPEAFEAHGRHVELSWALWPTVEALCRHHRFAQTLDPWTGEQGFTQDYSPAALALLDFVERLVGILPTPDGELWFTGLTAPTVAHTRLASRTSYHRAVDGVEWELRVTPDGVTITADGAVRHAMPAGLRLTTTRTGEPLSLVGMVPRTVTGRVTLDGVRHEVSVGPNEVVEPTASGTRSVHAPRLIRPC